MKNGCLLVLFLTSSFSSYIFPEQRTQKNPEENQTPVKTKKEQEKKPVPQKSKQTKIGCCQRVLWSGWKCVTAAVASYHLGKFAAGHISKKQFVKNFLINAAVKIAADVTYSAINEYQKAFVIQCGLEKNLIGPTDDTYAKFDKFCMGSSKALGEGYGKTVTKLQEPQFKPEEKDTDLETSDIRKKLLKNNFYDGLYGKIAPQSLTLGISILKDNKRTDELLKKHFQNYKHIQTLLNLVTKNDCSGVTAAANLIACLTYQPKLEAAKKKYKNPWAQASLDLVATLFKSTTKQLLTNTFPACCAITKFIARSEPSWWEKS